MRDQRDQARLVVSYEETDDSHNGTPGDNIPTCHLMGDDTVEGVRMAGVPNMYSDTRY